MYDLRSTGAADTHSEDVDPQAGPSGVLLGQPDARQSADPAQFARRDGVLQPAETVTRAGLHLGEHQGVVLAGDDVEFSVAAPPVALDDAQSHAQQVIDCHLFAERSEFLP